MARTGKLSAIEVSRAKGPGVLHDGSGLYLRVSASGAKSWVFRYQLGGRRRDMGLGAFPAISLAEARERAAAHRKQRTEGLDPLAVKSAQQQAQRLTGRTFREVAENLLKSKQAGWRNATHRYQWRNTLVTYAFPVLGDLPVSAVDTASVMRVLAPIWTTKTETANRLRGRIEAVLDAAKAHGYRNGENPARWRGHLDVLLPKPSKVHRAEHHAALPYPEIAAFMAELRSRESMSARALEFTILTAVRTGEALGARWGEINLAERLWTIPAPRMKADKEHRVPLSDAVIEVLEKVQPLAVTRDGKADSNAPVFPSNRRALPMTRTVMLKLLNRSRAGLTTHGFRSAFADWAAERTAYPREVVEMALAHSIENRVEAAYRRGDLFEKRRQLMDAWASYCDMPPDRAVVPLRAGR
ncbi:MAG TPA: integrase arm-type DNA-binding domain-containing protein [Stellaceae bacterium]|jgi:integrase|nr:integrase arm-type DNA-binding domain-containing protein [Stellaceae bacterium]